MKKYNVIIALYYAVVTLSNLIVRRLEFVDNKFVDIIFLFLIAIPFRKGHRNLFIFYSFIFFTSLLYFKYYNYQNIELFIILVNGILAFINIYFGIVKKKP